MSVFNTRITGKKNLQKRIKEKYIPSQNYYYFYFIFFGEGGWWFSFLPRQTKKNAVTSNQ